MINIFKDFICFRELTELAGTTTARISQSIIDNNLEYGIDYLKYGQIVLLNKNCKLINEKYINLIPKATDLSGLIPIQLFYSQLVSDPTNYNKEKLKYLLDNNIIEIIKINNINSLKFVKILNKELFDIFNDKHLNLYVVSSKPELEEMIKNKDISGYFKVNNNSFLTYY